MLYCRTEERIRKIVNLSRRRDRILEAPKVDLEGLAILASDYEWPTCQARRRGSRLGRGQQP